MSIGSSIYVDPQLFFFVLFFEGILGTIDEPSEITPESHDTASDTVIPPCKPHDSLAW